MKKIILTALILISPGLCGYTYTGKIFFGPNIYKEVALSFKNRKIIMTDWESGNKYEFVYDWRRMPFRGYEWETGHELELEIRIDGKGMMHDCDTGDYYEVDLGDFMRNLDKTHKRKWHKECKKSRS